jgi:hypothetical protein
MINAVRNTVLSVLNKNNYGYISPSDFNLYAKQAQMELYDEYFSSYNKTINMENLRTSGSDYANILGNLAENIEHFLQTDFLIPVDTTGFNTNEFYIPSLTTVGNDLYMVNKILCYTKILAKNYNDAVVAFELVDTTADFITAGVSVGDIVVNATTFQSSFVTAVVNLNELALYNNIFPTVTGDDYIVYSKKIVQQADKISSGKITMINNSMLMTPNLLFPNYVQSGEIIRPYPEVLNTYGSIQCTYFRFPKEPKWTYITLAAGEPVFDQTQSDYQDFELPLEYEYKLVVKILQYCGISIREIDVTSYAIAQEQHEQPTFSQKE